MFTSGSFVGWIVSQPKWARDRLIRRLNLKDADEFDYDWPQWARDGQKPPPGDWRVWLLLAGRGFGKTRTGAEMVRRLIGMRTARHVALVAPTAADARDVMVEGESGLLATAPPWDRPEYEPSKRRLTWENGAIATTYSADEPERLRGPQHDFAWCDELAAWRYPEAWDMLMFGLRLGLDPRAVVTTTPRPTKLIKALVADPKVTVTRGTTYDNAANLAPGFLEQIVRRYEGTRLGRQELDAEILDDVPGALWTHGLIDATRVNTTPSMTRIVVSIDPAVSSDEHADETGIVVAGRDAAGHGYVLADLSGRYTPTEWAKTAIAAYRAHAADRIVAEVNNGGDLVEATLRVVDSAVPFAAVHGAPGAHQYDRLAEAIALANGQWRAAALQSASWGMFQIVGMNFAACGFASVEDYVAAMCESEAAQLDAFAAFCAHEELRRFSRRGTGPRSRCVTMVRARPKTITPESSPPPISGAPRRHREPSHNPVRALPGHRPHAACPAPPRRRQP
jgi:phage terminase large subunit-like protein